MALQTDSDWETFFRGADIPPDIAKQYTKYFVENRITKDLLPSIDRQILHDLDITVVGDIMKIRILNLPYPATQIQPHHPPSLAIPHHKNLPNFKQSAPR